MAPAASPASPPARVLPLPLVLQRVYRLVSPLSCQRSGAPAPALARSLACLPVAELAS